MTHRNRFRIELVTDQQAVTRAGVPWAAYEAVPGLGRDSCLILGQKGDVMTDEEIRQSTLELLKQFIDNLKEDLTRTIGRLTAPPAENGAKGAE